MHVDDLKIRLFSNACNLGKAFSTPVNRRQLIYYIHVFLAFEIPCYNASWLALMIVASFRPVVNTQWLAGTNHCLDGSPTLEPLA